MMLKISEIPCSLQCVKIFHAQQTAAQIPQPPTTKFLFRAPTIKRTKHHVNN
jgi:hypothetical protein